MNKKILQEILEDVTLTLYQFDIPYFLIGGTLLGAIRDKNFIEWDTDIDLGIYYSGSFKKIYEAIKNLEKLGFNVTKFNISNITLDRGYRIDLFWFHEQLEKNHIQYFYSYLGDKKLVFPVTCLNGLETINFLNKSYPVPRNPKKYLETQFGNNWQIPNPKFTCENYNNIQK